jgi:hypothetical protein
MPRRKFAASDAPPPTGGAFALPWARAFASGTGRAGLPARLFEGGLDMAPNLLEFAKSRVYSESHEQPKR